MTFVMPYFSGNLLQRNWDAITAALNSGGSGSTPTANDWIAGDAIPVPSTGITVFVQNGGLDGTSLCTEPTVGTDDGKMLGFLLLASNGATVETSNFQFVETGTSQNPAVLFIAKNGTWHPWLTVGVDSL